MEIAIEHNTKQARLIIWLKPTDGQVRQLTRQRNDRRIRDRQLRSGGSGVGRSQDDLTFCGRRAVYPTLPRCSPALT